MVRMGRRVFLGVLLASSIALADETEVVHTRNGSVYRGELVEKVVDDHVTIKLATGEIKRIEWADIDASPPKPPPPPPQQQQRPTSPTVEVSFESDDSHATLQRYVGSGEVTVDYVTAYGTTLGSGDGEMAMYRDVCVASCTERIPAGGRFRVAGQGLIPTDSFVLHSNESNQITASMSSRGKRRAGQYLTLFGAAPTLIGAGLLVAAPGSSSVAACNGCVNLQASLFLWGGIVTGVGVTMLVVGIVLWATSGSTATLNGTKVGFHPSGIVF
jgi:hypothetical protein